MNDAKPTKAFIPGWLDDYPFSPTEFRVVCRVMRRGDCFESLPSIGHTCGMHLKTVRNVVQRLLDHHVIEREDRRGQSSVLRVRPFEAWRKRRKARPNKGSKTPPKRIPLPNGYPGIELAGDPSQTDTPHPSQNNTGDPSHLNTPEVYPLKGTQLRVSHKDCGAPEAAVENSVLPGMEAAVATPTGAAEVSRKSSRSSKRTAEAKGHPDHQRLIQEFTEAYKARNNGAAYKFSAGKDGKAVKDLLGTATVEDIMHVAKAGWELPDRATYLRQQSASLAGLASKWNEIQAEVNRNNGGQSNGGDF